jgi:hypothetical protein
MSDPTADSINTFGAFAGSSIFSGLLTFALTYPADCSSILSGGSCETVLGTYVMSESAAAGTSAVAGVVIGGLCALIASAINDSRNA